MSSKDGKQKENKNKEIKNEAVQNVIDELDVNNTVELSNEVDNADDKDNEIIEEFGISNKEKEELEEKSLYIINEYIPLSYYEADILINIFIYIKIWMDMLE